MRIGELSRRVGVSIDTLRAWERRYGLLKPRRSDGNVRLYSALDEARVQLMTRYIKEHVPAAQAAELVKGARFGVQRGRGEKPAERDLDWAALEMARALERYDETSADNALQQMLSEYQETAVIRDVLLPYLRALGERWSEGGLSVAREHFASNFLHARLMTLARGWDGGLGPRAVLASAPQDQHTLGLISFGIALHRHGWQITYLGAATPVATLREVAEELRPALIMVSASVSGSLDADLDALEDLAGLWPLALAGPGVEQSVDTPGILRIASDPISAAADLACRAHI